MSQEEFIDAGRYAKSGSRIERALRDNGLFVPRKAIEELNDAIGAIYIENLGKYNESLPKAKLISALGETRFKLELPFKGSLGMPLKGFEVADELLLNYIKDNPECGVVFNRQYSYLEGNDFRAMLEVLNEGFIKKKSPQNSIDIDVALSEPEASKWTGRTGR